MSDTLLARLYLDAQDAFLDAIDHVPAPGRGGPVGPLNAPGITVAHTATTHDGWLNRFVRGVDTDEWTAGWYARASEADPHDPPPPPLDEARAAFARVAQRCGEWVAGASRETLLEEAKLEGTPWEGGHTRNVYLVARSIAHLYVHAGELSVVASLLAADDMGLPGPLSRSTAPTAEDDWTVPIVAALLRDGYVEVDRAAEVTPTPAANGAMDRLNPVSHTLAHLVGREDRLWSVAAQNRPAHPRIEQLGPLEGAPAVPWGLATSALHEVTEGVAPWLDALTPAEGARPLQWRGAPSSVAAQVARSAGHFFSHAGEMMAHASLYGVPDLGMPGDLAHVARAAAAAAR